MMLIRAGAYFLGLAGANEVLGIRTCPRGKHERRSLHPRRCGQRAEFNRIVGIYGAPDAHAHEDGTLTASWTFKQLQRAAPSLV